MKACQRRALGVGVFLLAAACSKPDEKKADADVEASAPIEASVDAAPDVMEAAPPESDGGTPSTSTSTSTSTSSAPDPVGPRVQGDAGPTKPRHLVLDEDANGKTFDLPVGSTMVLNLTANPTSGFDWAVVKAPPALGAPAMGFVEATGKRSLSFNVKTALPPGEHTVQLAYRRGFEPGVAPNKTIKFTVRAR